MAKFLVFFLPFLFLQEKPVLKKVAEIEFKADGFTTDNLGNIYLRRAEELKKFDQNGKLLNLYSDKSLGRISSVDASNFLKLVVFYKDFSKVVFLDNMLAPTGEPIHLQRFQLEQATLAASSHNNGLWLYHQFEFQLIRLGQNMKPSHQTPNLMQLLGYPLSPNFLVEVNNVVYLNNPETGILIFDVYGTYNKTIPIKGLQSFQVFENKIFYFKDNEFKSFNMKTMEESTIAVPEQNPIDVRIEKKRMYVLCKGFLAIYAM